jgi:hypothetical protein
MLNISNNVAESPLADTMDTARLPTRLHELYPHDLVPVDDLPQEGEEDYYFLHKVADRIIKKLDDVSGLHFSLVAFSLKHFARNTLKKYFPPNLSS